VGGSTARIGEVLDCTPNPGAGVTPGADLVKVTLEDPQAICNDGSQAVAFVRRAAPGHEAHWVFHLQGGGSCGRHEDCGARWCSRNEKMTSTATPDGMVGKGLMRRESDNELGNANQVFLYYCSSDNWAGSKIDSILTADGQEPYRVDFAGFHIVEAVMDAVEAGITSDDGSQSLPPFEGEGWALFTGTSAGCAGVAHNADRFAERAAGRGLTPWIVCDANAGPVPDALPDGEAKETYVATRKERFEATTASANLQRDASCVAMQDIDPWLCDLPGYVLGNHVVDAPLFLRMDLGDGTISEEYLASGFSLTEFAEGVRTGLVAAAASEGLETPPRAIGVYGPGCGQHVGLTNDEWFDEATVREGGPDLTLHDGIVAWMAGEPLRVLDTVPPSTSVCGETTAETD
jgi:hypothetical protein